ncbi:DUF1624 domain-containing protein [Colwelliaceae bacterium 6441]
MERLGENIRFESIDQLRGLVIILMALDHTRDFFSPFQYAPEDLMQTTPELFFTRWITHFCAPVFVLLTGFSTFLFENKGNNKKTVRNFLLSRGIWLIFIELTVVNVSWMFSFNNSYFLQVIWVLGVSMIILAGLIYLPKVIIMFLGMSLILFHNAFDTVNASRFGDYSWLWGIIHQPMWVPFNESGSGVYIAYPLLPWIGVMAIGYAAGQWLFSDKSWFIKKTLSLGVLLTVSFLLLRFTNLYGDPVIWQSQARGTVYTVLSFLNTQKYPPSLLYLMMTIGPALILLAWLTKTKTIVSQQLTYFGRVPFFFYVLHVPFIHFLAAIYFLLTLDFYSANWQLLGANAFPKGYTPNLLTTYIAWGSVIFLMFFACKWFGNIKRTYNHWLLKYL